MKPPKIIYAKVGSNGKEEILRLSTSPFMSGNIEYMLPPSAEELQHRPFVSVSNTLPAADGKGKCRYALEVLRHKDNKIHTAYYSIAGFFSDRSFYSEYELKDVYAWRYIVDPTQLTVMSQDWSDHDCHVIVDTIHNGTVMVRNYHEDKETWFGGLYVDPTYRGQHVATSLLAEAERHAKYPIKVGVRQDAPSWLINFYIKRGYKVESDKQ